ncbi:hypothetical protein LIER_01429 [Lithospermum erythrorhizon]|uniref:C2HC zinc finger plants domain-containing protein n=1 Tax=Lithospermum erythrorhizon TaxID=34254 RepID=A0AAV3NQH1_LITER
MEGRDTPDMMEAEPSTAPPPPTQNDAVKHLLATSRQLIDQGQPSQALQAVVMAMRARGGEEAVYHLLVRARDLYRNKIQTSAAADELSSLFAECAIAEAMPLNSQPSDQITDQQSVEFDPHGTSILAETGREQVVLDAFSDGSSFVCLKCGGLVSNQRKEEHTAFWCGKI